MYEERKNIRRPFTESTWNEFQINVERIMTEYADAITDPSLYQTTDIEGWAIESHEMAKGLYDGIFENLLAP